MFLVNVWWPALGNLEGLYPEYEVRDLKDGTRFVDFAYLPTPLFKMAIELGGYGPHWREVTRWQFADNLMRQNHLLMDDWRLIRFAYDDVAEKPRRCQQVLLQAIGKWGYVRERSEIQLSPREQMIVRLAQGCTEPFTPAMICKELGMDLKTVIQYLKLLAEKGLVIPEQSPAGRIMRYQLPHLLGMYYSWIGRVLKYGKSPVLEGKRHKS